MMPWEKEERESVSEEEILQAIKRTISLYGFIANSELFSLGDSKLLEHVKLMEKFLTMLERSLNIFLTQKRFLNLLYATKDEELISQVEEGYKKAVYESQEMVGIFTDNDTWRFCYKLVEHLDSFFREQSDVPMLSQEEIESLSEETEDLAGDGDLIEEKGLDSLVEEMKQMAEDENEDDHEDDDEEDSEILEFERILKDGELDHVVEDAAEFARRLGTPLPENMSPDDE